jgi:hypothetical protein
VGALLDRLLDGKPISMPQLREGVVLRTTGDLLNALPNVTDRTFGAELNGSPAAPAGRSGP